MYCEPCLLKVWYVPSSLSQPDSTRGQDLRAFIAQRREERNKKGRGGRHGHYDDESESSEEEKEAVSTSLSSVVKIMKQCVCLILMSCADCAFGKIVFHHNLLATQGQTSAGRERWRASASEGPLRAGP